MEQAIGLYDFKSADENELSTYKNEILEVVKKDQDWWTVRNKYGQTGLVPVTYVAAPVDGSDTQIISRGKTTKSHKAKTENELSIEKGKQIAILDNTDAYWWFVGYSGQTGYLPKNIIHEFKSRTPKSTPDKENDEKQQALKKFGFKEIAPEKGLCDEDTTVLFSFKNTLPKEGQFKVIFKGEHCEKTQDGERLNDFTIKTKTPKYHPAEKVFITINHVEQNSQQELVVKGVEFMFQSKLDIVHKILSGETDPLNFLCSSFQINDLQSVDNVLSGNLEKKIPDGIDLLKSSKNVLVHEQALPKETPTLVHFAAYYNLKKLAKALLKCPGAKEAMSIKNCHGNGPAGVAKLRQHMEMEELLESHHLNDTPDDLGEDEYMSMERCYESYIKMGGGNSQSTYVVPDSKTRSHGEEEELYEVMEGGKSEPEELYDVPRDQEDRFEHYDDELDDNGNRITQEDNMQKQLEEYKVFGRMTEKEVQLALLMKRVKERYITQEQALEMARVLRLEPQAASKYDKRPPPLKKRVSGFTMAERKTQSLPRTSSTSSGSSMSSIGSTGSGYASDGNRPPAPAKPSGGFNYLTAGATFPKKPVAPPPSPRKVNRTPSDPPPPVPGRRR